MEKTSAQSLRYPPVDLTDEVAGNSRVDVAVVLDQARFGGAALTIFVLTTLALIFDGFDVQAMAFVAPAILHNWGLERAALAPVLALGLIGMAVGALALSGFGDRYGRRPTLILTMLVVALGALACAQSRTIFDLMAWRFVTGIGLGASAPNAIALMVEFTPRKVRNTLVAITLVGVPIGGILGAEIAAELVPALGWAAVFYVGAALPALTAAAMWLWLRESPRYLAQRPRRRVELALQLNKIIGRSLYSADDEYIVQQAAAQTNSHSGVRALLEPLYRRDTLALWLIFFTNLFTVYVFFGWLPTALSSVGLPIELALRGSLFFNLGGVVGALLGAPSVSRWGSRPVLIVLGLGAIVALVALGVLPASVNTRDSAAVFAVTLLAIMTMAGVTTLGLQVTMYSVAAQAYPTRMRVSGVGWAQGLARLAGVLSSYAGIALLSLGHGVTPFFMGLALVLTVTLLGVCILQRHIRPAVEKSSVM
jgi:MFS transporter, AAHS family, 4-hydroxybenzoate transporter